MQGREQHIVGLCVQGLGHRRLMLPVNEAFLYHRRDRAPLKALKHKREIILTAMGKRNLFQWFR